MKKEGGETFGKIRRMVAQKQVQSCDEWYSST